MGNHICCDSSSCILSAGWRPLFQECLSTVEREKEEGEKAWSQKREELENRVTEVCVVLREEGNGVEGRGKRRGGVGVREEGGRGEGGRREGEGERGEGERGRREREGRERDRECVTPLLQLEEAFSDEEFQVESLKDQVKSLETFK